jgi:hypothetical protein
MTSPENPLSDLSPEDLQLQPSTAERLVVLVADYGLDPRVVAAVDPETTEAFLYPGMTPLLGNVLDGLKAASIEELHELSHEAFDEGFDDYRGRAGRDGHIQASRAVPVPIARVEAGTLRHRTHNLPVERPTVSSAGTDNLRSTGSKFLSDG